MKAPDKIYLIRKHPEPFWFKDKQLDSDVEYIRKDIVDEMINSAEDHAYFAGQEKLREKLLEVAKNMKRICKEAEPIEKAYQTVIDKIESL